MNQAITGTVPRVPLSEFKRTKIIATVGPATNSYEGVYGLIKAGANGLRLNFSHGTHEEREIQIQWIRKASAEIGKPVAIIEDLQGPKVRVGDFEGIINIAKNEQLRFAYKSDYEKTGVIPTQYDLAKHMKRGERLFLYDGKIRTTVTSVVDGIVYARAENSGILIKRKGINLPDTDFGGDIITAKDRDDIAWGSERDIDYMALSFVQTANDILHLKRLLKNLGSEAKVIAKIETPAATKNLEEIMQVSDAVMVARGDLALEVSPEAVPIIQRKIISLGLQYNKPTIVATQMLATMTEEPEPTRAEVSDVATAVLVGSDAVMLSDETANGKYPHDAVRMMRRIIIYTQENAPVRPLFNLPPRDARVAAIAEAIIRLADQIRAKAIVAETRSGATALVISGLRPVIPIIAVTSVGRVAQQMALYYGCLSYVRPDSPHAATKLTDWLRTKKMFKKGDMVVTASGRYPGIVGTTDTIKVRMLD